MSQNREPMAERANASARGNPKLEIRSPKQSRNPKSASARPPFVALARAAGFYSNFGSRISAFAGACRAFRFTPWHSVRRAILAATIVTAVLDPPALLLAQSNL